MKGSPAVETVVVYKSRKHDGMYLYVRACDALERVPADLLARFGTPVEVMRLDLAPDRALARAEARAVLGALADRGFYLQLPPTQAELVARRS
jgi:uncharacterized protein YcgL (UPF0745 family)